MVLVLELAVLLHDDQLKPVMVAQTPGDVGADTGGALGDAGGDL